MSYYTRLVSLRLVPKLDKGNSHTNIVWINYIMLGHFVCGPTNILLSKKSFRSQTS